MDDFAKICGLMLLVALVWEYYANLHKEEESEELMLARLLKLPQFYWKHPKELESQMVWAAYRTEIERLKTLRSRGLSERTIKIREEQLRTARQIIWRRYQAKSERPM